MLRVIKKVKVRIITAIRIAIITIIIAIPAETLVITTIASAITTPIVLVEKLNSTGNEKNRKDKL